MRNDETSDRIRCDFPSICGTQLADTLIQRAEEWNRGKIISIVTESHAHDLQKSGFRLAAQMPKAYEGCKDIFIMSYNRDEDRLHLANPKEVSKVESLLETVALPEDASLEQLCLKVAVGLVEESGKKDSGQISQLIAETFPEYPTPSSESAYIQKYIEEGNPFHGIRDKDRRLVACASADLFPQARTAELTDCATLPEYRGQGYMRALLVSLMKRLSHRQHYPTAFTMARARIPGINILFKQLGFQFCGRLSRSCLIGDGLEDMNIWARQL